MRDLTDAQREQVKAIHEKHAERKCGRLLERARTAREALDNAVMSGNAANLQALSIEVGNAETELTFAQAQVQSEIFKVLTAEQKQKIAERRKQMEERREEMMKRRQEQNSVGLWGSGSSSGSGVLVPEFWFRVQVPDPDLEPQPRPTGT